MKTYISRAEALDRYDITPDELDDLIQSDALDIVRMVDQDQKQFLIYDDDLAAYIADRDITSNQFDHLRGNLLSMGEAGIKHGVATRTISGWVKRGLLEVKGSGPRNAKLVDEADVAYLVAKGRAKRMRPGKKVFYDE